MQSVVRKMDLLVVLFVVVMAIILTCPSAMAAGGGSTIGSFGPTGVEIDVQRDHSLKVIGVQAGSPAEGKFVKGQIITTINGKKLVDGDIAQRQQLSDVISNAEATDGVIKFGVKGKGEVVVTIPVLGAFSKTWPVNCEKTKKIIRGHADYIGSLPVSGRNSLSSHSLQNGLAVLMLLSTGAEKDLDVARKIYVERMKGFRGTDTGPQTWNNGFQGIAVCEYYLRTGDKSVMPLINAICESARKYQVHGGWSHWATAINPKYTGGGLMNAAGTNVLTTLLLAKQCGAEVNEDTLQSALLFFYRFAGHGANPYGDHRPEDGYRSNNGKTEMLALAMNAASKAVNGEVYAMARDKCAMNPLYSYRDIMTGHAGPIGSMWHGVAAALMIDKKPELYRNKMEDTRWFYELSRRFDGSFGMSGMQRYDNAGFGYSMGLSLTAPLKTLQITGAPRSKYAKSFTLPKLPWGRTADLEFFSIEGGRKYKQKDIPHVEITKIANASEAELECFAYHPESSYRQIAADTIRKKGYFRLIEKLLGSSDPRARHTACWAINRFQPWKVTASPGWISSQAISKKDFTPKMFNSLIKIVKNPNESIWNVDGALSALALASPQQTKKHLNLLLKWLEYDEWWIHEAVCQALSPALEDPKAIKIVLPKIIDMLAKNDHIKGHGYVVWMFTRTAVKVSEDMRLQLSDALVDLYGRIPSQTWAEGDIDLSAITYMLLESAADRILTINPKAAVDVAKLTVTRKKDLSHRGAEGLLRHLKLLLGVVDKLDENQKRQLGKILVEHYRPIIIEQNRKGLEPVLTGRRTSSREMNDLIKIDGLVGANDGWKILGNDKDGAQVRSYCSFDPKEVLEKGDYNRYRQVTIPAKLEGWYKSEYDAVKNGWKTETTVIGDRAPAGYKGSNKWNKQEMKNLDEVILTRKVVELDNLDFARLRLMVYSRQGFRIYINGNLVVENKGRSKTWMAQERYLDEKMKKHLKKGKNVIAAIGFLQYFRGKEGNVEVVLEGLKKYPKID